MIDRKPIIGVMGSHEKNWDELTGPVGRMIARHDYHLLTGAGGGVMSSVSKAFTEYPHRRGISIGVVPTTEYDGGFVPREEYPNPYIEIPILTPLDTKAQNDSMPYSRNYVNVMSSQALVILPGDHGTKNEVSLALMYNKPMILFGPKASFDGFPEIPTWADDIEELREFLEAATAKIRKTMDKIEGENENESR